MENSRQIVSSFDQLLNIALKYVTRHCEMNVREIDLNRTGYKLSFLTAATILPLYCLLIIIYGCPACLKLGCIIISPY